VASAAAAGALVGYAGGGWRGGLVIGAVGLIFAAFALSASVARCPACGASLGRLDERRTSPEGRGAADAAGGRRCRSCRVPYE
jgi:hypothetical protein